MDNQGVLGAPKTNPFFSLNFKKNTSSISKKTSYLIAGENMGPSKREKAEKLGIPIISEDEFLSLLQ